MLLYAVILFGLVVVLQLHGINRRLESNHSALRELSEELRWHKEPAFAHDLKEWLKEIPRDIVEELQWHKSSTFAHELREWLQEVSNDITGELRLAATEISNTLSAIENNTSHD